MRHVTDDERRARIGVRHALAPAHRAATPEAATDAVVALHCTEPATPYLSCWARTTDLTVADVDRALYEDRSLVKQLAMRRTLFAFPPDLLPAVWGSASARVAGFEGRRLAKDAELLGLTVDGEAWLAGCRADVIAELASHPDGRTAADLREAVPSIGAAPAMTDGGSIASRVLTHLGATADLVRGANTGHWRTSRPRWTLAERWLAEVPLAWSAADGNRELVRRWLRAYGPGTEGDLVWWLGSTKAIVRAALAELEAVEVALDGGTVGWLLPDDLDEVEDPGPWAALLPVLDPTVMGWQGRGWHLAPHREQTFDRNGNAGTTAWVDGRVVGVWVQSADGTVEVHLLEEVSSAARKALDAEARRLTGWLDGVVVGTGYKSAAMKAALAGLRA